MFGNKRCNADGIVRGGGDGERSARVEILLDVDEEEGDHGFSFMFHCTSIIWREEIGNRNRLLFAPHKSMMIMIDHDLS